MGTDGPFILQIIFGIFFRFKILFGLNGSNNSSTCVMKNYIADVMHPNQRIMGYGVSYIAAGLGLFSD